jgi:hypothetical protein
MRELWALVVGNARRRWREWRDRRPLAGETVAAEIDSGWSRAIKPAPAGAVKAAPAAHIPPCVLERAARRSAADGSAAPTSSLSDDLRSALVRDVWRRIN